MNTSKLNGFKFFLAALITIFSFSSFHTANASTNSSARIGDVALKAISEKLKSDLARTDASVKFSKVNRYNVSKSQVGLKGNGTAILDSGAETLPINFDVEIDVTNFSVARVDYNFAEADIAAAAFAAAALEENVTQKLLKQLAKDHKTDNVVVAIDGFDANNKQLKGIGEVRIGDFEWRKIQVDVSLNAKGSVSSVKYQLQD